MEKEPILQSRISSIDIVRGLVMIIMALDHIRDLMHIDSLNFDPVDLASTSPALFFTRWVTHLCAPTFVFLSGTSAYLAFQNKPNPAQNRKFLLSRGLWLIVLEFTLVNFALWFDIHFSLFLFQVIAAIGTGFLVLGLLLHVPGKWLSIIGLMIILLHHLHPIFPLTAMGVIPIQQTTIIIGYPPVPWIALMLVGYGCGSYFQRPQEERKRLLLVTGTLSILLFITLRWLNNYGDPAPWSAQKNHLYTLLSFLNVTKYPPSLLYDLLMLGFMFLCLAVAERAKGAISNFIEVFGRVPLFFYLLHWYIIRLTLFLVLFLQGYSWKDFVFGARFGRPEGQSGLALWAIYLVWLGIIFLLYPVCKGYGRYKFRHKTTNWLKYL